MVKKKNTGNSQDKSVINHFKKQRDSKTIQLIIGLFCVSFALFLFITFISFLFNWQEDQSILNRLGNQDIRTENATGQFGSGLGNIFVYDGFGIAAFIIPYITFVAGLRLLLNINKNRIIPEANWLLIAMIIISLTIGYVDKENAVLSGIIGFELNEYLQTFLGKTGLLIFILFVCASYIIIKFKDSLEHIANQVIKSIFPSKNPHLKKTTNTPDRNKDSVKQKNSTETNKQEENTEKENTKDNPILNNEISLNITNRDQQKTISNRPLIDENEELTFTIEKTNDEEKVINIDINTDLPKTSIVETDQQNKDELKISVEQAKEEKTLTENLSDKLVANFGEFDPKLELSEYRFPTFDLLKQYDERFSTDTDELELNKNKIVETLKNYKIGIDQIKAIVGPTITLYEIVPEAGIRISKIKNLEDDIALSLAALGIRIIAPIPGKGTIGIEVPNKNATIVSMHSVITSKKFQESNMELPLALGKTIANETFVVDLAKMPHLLMAGATGQGKSVGLNAILTSLLYRKHPAEVKFVLVDPKKVELTLFNKIERHYLAKLPDNQEAIITDNTKVIYTLNSLCIEMDNRYELLKKAMVRNIKEYNSKLKQRKLNPDNGHRYLPYIILVIDEFADLIMTAGKEVETPVARLAQLARAIGIHLIVATQRPSVNVITGMIKANFPSRIAFRVTSKIDSRTILDAPGADQLIGRGDMLFSGGNDLTRIQCAFVDTPEVEKITTFIGSQRAYPDAYLLPEYEGEDGGTNIDIDISDRDKLFRQAAEVIIIAQQGSASLLQRKLKLGYNRAGRIIDQLEAAGIVGPFEGSKARQVLITDLTAMDNLLSNENQQ